MIVKKRLKRTVNVISSQHLFKREACIRFTMEPEYKHRRFNLSEYVLNFDNSFIVSET